MIPLAAIREVKSIVVHDACPDGTASAILLHDCLGNMPVTWLQYNTKAHVELPATPGIIFADFSPHPSRVQEFVDAGAIVLDHHRGTREIVEAFGERGVFADEATEPGVSGAVLAFREVWKRTGGGDFVGGTVLWWGNFAKLAGIRDTWQRSSPLWRKACAQAAALLFYPRDQLFDKNKSLHEQLQIGEVVLAKNEERDIKLIAESHRFSVASARCLIFNSTQTSDVAERMAEEVDLVLGFHYKVDADAQQLVVSCRSRGPISALSLAKANGGGGHEHAAGFTLKNDFTSLEPYTRLRALVSQHVFNVGA